MPKQAASFDLPITLGILAGSGQLISDRFDFYAVVGELALDGSTRPTKGALSMAIAAARQEGLAGLLVPSESAGEAAVVEGIDVIAVSSGDMREQVVAAGGSRPPVFPARARD